MSNINNVCIYGLDESVAASGYPMRTVPLDSYKNSEKEYQRANKLANSPIGSGHDQFLTSIIVQFDLTFPLKAWTELQRYHFIDFCSSMSTMHKITNMNIDKCCNKYVSDNIKSILRAAIVDYKQNPTDENFYKIIYNIPSGFEYTARLTTNYRQLKTIYSQRKTHKLPDWHMFCDWIKELPHSEWIIGENKNNARRN